MEKLHFVFCAPHPRPAEDKTDLARRLRGRSLMRRSDLVNTRITARVQEQHNLFLINPYGLLFDEITAERCSPFASALLRYRQV